MAPMSRACVAMPIKWFMILVISPNITLKTICRFKAITKMDEVNSHFWCTWLLSGCRCSRASRLPANSTARCTSWTRNPTYQNMAEPSHGKKKCMTRIINKKFSNAFFAKTTHLQVSFIFNELFRCSVQQTDMRVGSNHSLSIQGQNKSQDTVGCWVLRTKV